MKPRNSLELSLRVLSMICSFMLIPKLAFIAVVGIPSKFLPSMKLPHSRFDRCRAASQHPLSFYLCVSLITWLLGFQVSLGFSLSVRLCFAR